MHFKIQIYKKLQTRIDREKEYHNKAFSENVRHKTDKFYSIFTKIRRQYGKYILKNSHIKTYLEYGCGPGSYSFTIAEKGGKVTGIDISDWAINEANKEAKQNNLSLANYKVMNAEALDFNKDTFDVVCGSGILHHLDLEKAYKELSRVLKPNGKGVFLEPLGHNPFINLYRKLTPTLRTVDEHPLKSKDIKTAQKYFKSVEIEYYYLFSIMASLFHKTKLFKGLLNFLFAIDSFLFKYCRFLRKYAWYSLIILEEPIEYKQKDS